ncbi:MAG: threonine/serine exporter family protein [Bacteroidales bacterium]|nr:threonine/serine exporter family protein [Bacteroidales bacterium]
MSADVNYSQKTTPHNDRALDVATEAGHILLENGAEISRVEETMDRIASAYGVEQKSFFVLSNGIIATGRDYAQASFIPIKGTQLSRVVDVNQLSRDVVAGRCPIGEAESRLEAIRSSAGKPWWELTLGIAFGVGAFSILFGGSLVDAAATFAAGLLLGLFMTFVSPHLSRIFGNVAGGMVGGLLCIVAVLCGFGEHLPNMIIGTIIALVPGVPFTNGMRDLANEDYIAGATRLLDAFLAFLCIALGVALAFLVEGWVSHVGVMQLGAPSVDFLASHWAIQLVAALVGTVGFAILFGAPRRYYIDCGLAGMAGWGVYIWMLRSGASPAGAAFCGALVVALVSNVMALLRRCPITVFLICGIIPLVPGGGIFWTAYYLVSNQLRLASSVGFVAIKVTIAIAGGIIIATGVANQALRLRKTLTSKS